MIKIPKLVRGDDRELIFTAEYSEGSLIGCEIKLTIKERASQLDDEAAIQLSTTDGTIAILNATQFKATFDHEWTEMLVRHRYFVDVQIKNQIGKSITAKNLEPTVDVATEITRD